MVATPVQPGFSQETGVEQPRHAGNLADEGRIIAAAQGGDTRAFNQLVCAYQGIAHHTAYRILGESEPAADAVQDAFISAYKHLRTFRGGSFRAWLLRIVTNACYDQLRAKRRQPTVPLEVLSADSQHTGLQPNVSVLTSPESFVEQRELGELIQVGLQTLPVEQRIVVILSDVAGFTYEEIGQITSTNIGTVKSRLARARNHLRDFLVMQGAFPSAHLA
jgi:RNA polymerase sigma-70 factor, ECF subfamily